MIDAVTVIYMPSRVRYYTVDDVAKMFVVSPATVRRWIRDKRLGAIDIRAGSERRSREYRVPSTAISAYAAERNVSLGDPLGEEQAGETGESRPADSHPT